MDILDHICKDRLGVLADHMAYMNKLLEFGGLFTGAGCADGLDKLGIPSEIADDECCGCLWATESIFVVFRCADLEKRKALEDYLKRLSLLSGLLLQPAPIEPSKASPVIYYAASDAAFLALSPAEKLAHLNEAPKLIGIGKLDYVCFSLNYFIEVWDAIKKTVMSLPIRFDVFGEHGLNGLQSNYPRPN